MLSQPTADVESAALSQMIQHLAHANYRFITTTPLTHQRVLAQRGLSALPMATNLQGVFGWNLPFKASACSGMTRELLAAMRGGGVLHAKGDVLQSRVRVASIDNDLFVHSAYPTTQEDAVFFGPDTYRFARFIQQGIGSMPSTLGAPMRLLDVGCGSGAGGVVAARALSKMLPGTPLEISMNDINPLALRYTAVNATAAGIAFKAALGNALRAVKGEFDLIISNPPYLEDAGKRAYRHGGAGLGRALSVRIGKEAIGRLTPGGRLLLYTGVAIVDGVDAFLADMQPLLADPQLDWFYSEIDPDVFGEELEQPVYRHADRIAAVGLTVTRTRKAR